MKKGKTQSGFTLFEVIVVIAIISFALTIATISIGNPQVKRLKQHSQRIASLIQLASEQAIFNSQDYALSIWQSGYAFYTLTETGWLPVSGDRMFRQRNLPEELLFILYLDGVNVTLYNEDKNTPQIFITSDGEISPFQLEITDGQDWSYQINFDERGDFKLVLTDV